MKAQGLARLGRDAEVRFTQAGEPVATLALAFTFGKKGADGNRPTQWVDASLWGKRAESLAPYLVKGGQVVAYLDDVHVQTFTKQDGTQGHKLAARVADLELIGGRSEGAAPAPAPRAAAPRPAPAPAPAAGGSGFDDMDDDIPF